MSATPQIQLTKRARNAVLLAVMLGLFLSALDQNVVGTALPRIVTDLGGNSLYTWVVTIYMLTSTITVPIYGKLSDVYGRKILLIIGVAIFLAGSWLSGFSQNMTQLIIFRGIQGLGAGALFPISLAIIGDLFTPRERGRYQGLFGAVFGLSFILGPFIGGWITDNISWRWVFYVNMPLGCATLIVIAVMLPNFHPAVATRVRDLDFLGIILFTGGVVFLLLGLTNKGLTDSHGQLHSWMDPSVGGLILLGVMILAVFLFVEARATQAIIPLNLFRDRTYSATNLATFMTMFGMFAAFIFLPRYYQGVKGISATESGYMIWPLLVGLMGMSVLTGLLISKIGRYKWVIVPSMGLAVVGSVLMTFIQWDSPDWFLWLGMFIMGAGIGPSMSGFTVVVQNVAPPAQLGVATSTLTFLRQVGGTIGLAIAGTLFAQRFQTLLPERLVAYHVPAQLAARFGHGNGSTSGQNLTGVGLAGQLAKIRPRLPQSLIQNIVDGVHDAFTLAIGDVFWLTVVAAALSFLAVLIIPDLRLRDRATLGGEAAAAITGSEARTDGTSGLEVAAQ